MAVHYSRAAANLRARTDSPGLELQVQRVPADVALGQSDLAVHEGFAKTGSHVQKHSDSVQSVCRLRDVRMEDLIRCDRVLNKVAPRDLCGR